MNNVNCKKKFHLLRSMFSIIVLMSATMLFSPSVFALTACGEPSYDPTSGPAIRIWQDCAGPGDWYVRVTGDLPYIRFTGSLTSDQPYTTVTAWDLEGADVLDTSVNTVIEFNLALNTPYQDGFNFTVPNNATLTLEVSVPSNPSVLLGATENPAILPTILTSGVTPSTNKIVFVTSQRWTGDLGGIAGADAKCQQEADAAGLSGGYSAWISIGGNDARDRVSHSTSPYVRTDGQQIAANFFNFTHGVHDVAISLDATGAAVGFRGRVWSITDPWGDSLPTGESCVGWTTGSPSYTGYVGYVDEHDSTMWSVYDTRVCTELNHLYCVQQ